MKRAIFYIMKKHYKFSRSLIALFVMFALLIVAAYAADIKALTQKAQQGDIKSQVELGFMYHEGNGVKKDFKEAAKWWNKASAQGYTKVRYDLDIVILPVYSRPLLYIDVWGPAYYYCGNYYGGE